MNNPPDVPRAPNRSYTRVADFERGPRSSDGPSAQRSSVSSAPSKGLQFWSATDERGHPTTETRSRAAASRSRERGSAGIWTRHRAIGLNTGTRLWRAATTIARQGRDRRPLAVNWVHRSTAPARPSLHTRDGAGNGCYALVWGKYSRQQRRATYNAAASKQGAVATICRQTSALGGRAAIQRTALSARRRRARQFPLGVTARLSSDSKSSTDQRRPSTARVAELRRRRNFSSISSRKRLDDAVA